MPTSEDKFYRAKITSRVEFAPDLWAVRLNPVASLDLRRGSMPRWG